MGKSKKGPALFELLGVGGDSDPASAQIPRWWSAGKKAPDLHESRAARNAPNLTLVSEDRSGDGEPIFELDGNRVRFSFTSVTAAVAIFAILGVVTAGYLAGVQSGELAGYKRGLETVRTAEPLSATDEIQLARAQPVATHLLAPLTGQSAPTNNPAPKPAKAEPAATSAAAPAKTAPGPGWVRDLTYIVVQEFARGAAENARAAQQFLAQKGVDAAVVPAPGGGVHLITAQGYNHKDAAQKRAADQLLAKVRTIGEQYFASGGGYKLEGYYKTLKKDTW